MGECKSIENELRKISTTIYEEKSSEYLKSTELVDNLYARITDNIKKNIYREFCLENLKKLIEISIVIHNYPKRIIRKGTKTQSGIQFDSSIMCLLKPAVVTFSNFNITQQMCNLQNGMNIPISGKVKFQDNYWDIKNMKYEPENPVRSSRSSTCEKCVILFEFQAWYNEKHISLKCIEKQLFSDTVITICHSHQEIDCLITLFWDDYYRRENREQDPLNFVCMEYSTSEDLIENFSNYCMKETKRPLTENNKIYLLEMVRALFQSQYIKLDDFMKRPMPKSKLSFGKWLMSIIKMLKIPTLIHLWQNGFIEGFISKNVKNILTETGSFLLRFSERKAAIGVVLRSSDHQIDPWNPYADSQLRSSNLSNLLSDFPRLEFIRKANGDFLNCQIALTGFKDDVPIDDGYTQRGHIPQLVDTFDTIEDIATFDNIEDVETIQDFENIDDFANEDFVSDNLDELNARALALLQYEDDS